MAYPIPKLYRVFTDNKTALNKMLARAGEIGVFCWHGLTGAAHFHTTKGNALFIMGEYAHQCRVVSEEMNKPAFDAWYAKNFMTGNHSKK